MHLKVPPPVAVAIALLMLYAAGRWLPGLTLTFPGQTILAILLIAAGLAIGAVAIAEFLKARTTFNPVTPHKARALVTDGLYRVSRNPMYVADVLIILALAVHIGTLSVLAVVPLFVWYLTKFQIKPEEKHLRQIFGRDYADYCARVRRWI
ncbi:MAG: isoprenylcysteine carboxylmethyltransferase family protein [Roseibium sp.]